MIFSNHRWALLANLYQAIVSWSILFVLIRLGSKDDVGVYSYIQALLLPLQLFFTLKLRTVQCSDSKDIFKPIDYHRVRSFAAFLNAIIGSILLTWLYLYSSDEVVLLGGLALLFGYSLYILRESLISIFQKNNNNKNFFKINFYSGSMSVLCFTLVYFYTRQLLLAIISLSLIRAAVFFLVEVKIFKKSHADITLRVKKFKSLCTPKTILVLRESWPLGVTALFGALFTSIPKFTIKAELGYEPLAVYATVTSLLVAFNLLVNSFVQSALPDLSKLYINDFDEFFIRVKETIIKITLFSTALSVVVFFIGETFLFLLFGKSYQDNLYELLLVVFCGFTLSLFSISNLMLSSQRTFFAQLPIYGLCCALIFVLSIFGVNFYGVPGALVAQGLSYLVGFFVSIAVFKKYRLKAYV